jgi:hypothetical protein
MAHGKNHWEVLVNKVMNIHESINDAEFPNQLRYYWLYSVELNTTFSPLTALQ